jgi:hypothetical protein
MASGLVFLDNSMCNSAVDYRHGAKVCRICRFVVSGVDSSKSFLDRCSKCGSLTRVVSATGFILSCPLLGLS